MGNEPGSGGFWPWVAIRCSVPFEWQSRQLLVSPVGTGPLPLHSGVPLLGSGPIRPACRAF